MSLLLLLTGAALAGSGPWTTRPGDHNVYVGADVGGFDTIANGSGGSVTLGTPVRGLGVHAVYTVGLVDGLDGEVILPFERGWAADPDKSFCVDGRPDDWCDTTQGVGDIGAMLRLRLLDEAAYRPITLSARLMGRTGAAYAGQRSRLTTVGDGQTDLGLGLAVGRTGAAGSGRWYRISASGSYWYRFGVGTIDGRKVPADEIGFGFDALGSPVRWFGLGVALGGFHRLGGTTLGEAEIGTRNAWVGLDAAQLRVGPKMAFYTDDGWTFFGAVSLTGAARNSPTNLASASVGVGRYFKRRERASEAE